MIFCSSQFILLFSLLFPVPDRASLLQYQLLCLNLAFVNRQSSFEFAESRWCEIKKETVNNPNIVFIFVGMKKDMEEEREISIPVPFLSCSIDQKARQFASINKMLFYEISLIAGNEILKLHDDLSLFSSQVLRSFSDQSNRILSDQLLDSSLCYLS